MKSIRTLLVCLLFLGCLSDGCSSAGGTWQGVDEAVVNRIAREHGRGEQPSLIPSAKGDLQLFLFLLAGTVGGFVAGYCWRMLLEGKNKRAAEKIRG